MICPKEKCTGCHACYNKCPRKAIKMTEDNNGFLYPCVDETKCIKCNLCKKVCPSIENVELVSPLKCYAMARNNVEARSASTSGGAAALFYEYILKNNGVVYGTTFENNTFKQIRVDKIEDLYKLKGSKYVQSYVGDSYSQVLNDLKNGIKVLYIGTPCQIAGLKKYLNKDYEQLYTIDIICHGVPSQKYLFDEINLNVKDKYNKIKFRTEEGFYLVVYNDDEELYKRGIGDSDYYQGFMNGFFYRENCYSCKYAGDKRCSDLTIGDFWGLGSDSSLYIDKDKGVNVLLPITEKGLELINNNVSEMKIEERSIVEAINGNKQLQKPVNMPKKYYKFKDDYIKYGFLEAYKKNRKFSYLKRKLKKIKIINIIYNRIRG